MPSPPLITLLTDFGLADHYVAAMKGVILGICPDARLVDITHQIQPFNVAQAAFTLSQAYPCFPAGTIHVAVVDPGVGSARRPILIEADNHTFIGPDNGVFTFPLTKDPHYTALTITAEHYFRHPVSQTFHGRDIFAPIAAYYAAGMAPAQLGETLCDPVLFDLGPPTRISDGVWSGRILYVDRFGNLVTNFRLADVPEITGRRFKMEIGTGVTSWYHPSYAEANGGSIFLLQGSSGYLEVSINQGDAAGSTGASAGTSVRLRLM